MITGYRLYQAKDLSNIYTLVYDGSGNPNIRSRVLTNLTTGSRYDYKVSAINFNGEGPTSTILTTYSCLVPTGLSNPTLDVAASTYSAVKLTWTEPTSLGGCPLIGYAIYRNEPDQSDPLTGSETWVEANQANDANIRNRPSLSEATVTNYAAGSVGKTFKYRLEAINVIGSSFSDYNAYLLG